MQNYLHFLRKFGIIMQNNRNVRECILFAFVIYGHEEGERGASVFPHCLCREKRLG